MDGYSYAYISEPVEFRHVEGKALDFRKTFDVRGRGTDEMLQLYLRKANLSDDLDRLPAIQRRAYVYDIIRSHKGPGYWVPPSMQVSSDVFAHPPPAVRPPPAATARTTPYADNASLYSMKSSSSSNSLDRYLGAPPSTAIAGPSFATSVLVSSKGSKYEISGPVNFQHVSGDVTRDRTRNAFDLNADANDNVLRKYMMERGITEADIADMRRQDVVKKIVHSNFTWMPKKQDFQAQPKVQEHQPRPLLYATISTNNKITPPPSPPPTPLILKPGPTPSFANYASLTSRFVDISDMDMPSVVKPAAQTPFRQQEVGSVVPVQVQSQPHQVIRPKVPPPPSAVTANNTYAYPAAIDMRQVRPSGPPKSAPETYATIAPQRKAGTMRIPPPAPPKPTTLPNTSSMTAVQYATVSKPPPPAPPIKPAPLIKAPAAVYAPPPPPQQRPSPVASGIPPPPPPMPAATTSGGPPPPPPPPMPALTAGGPPRAIQKSDLPKAAPTASAGGDRDAFLESIRNGVALKKVDTKAATISGIKPRPERKAAPPAMDFMSELKLGLTLRRTKNPAENPYSDESQA
ncbi:formin-like protein 3 isoform X1 [Drosophila pseudoobscura]|uniref:Formin-like protein 3 isoform X1 n=2 Tax=Drosophila pseudoobscura pseudoobscura TaxID=46245 RepID=A0A6I8UNZ4_DROPS|nr:formin-like protein 3 isoform X1 [Drosophila pseudoobscura]